MDEDIKEINQINPYRPQKKEELNVMIWLFFFVVEEISETPKSEKEIVERN